MIQIPAQIAGLWLVLQAGQTLAAHLPIPVPGNVVGMALLFALLATGLVKESWQRTGAGHWLLLVLGLSGLVGLAVTGAIAQMLRRPRPERRAEWNASPSTHLPDGTLPGARTA